MRVRAEGKDQRESSDSMRTSWGWRGGAAKVWAELAGARHTGFAPTLISGAALNCGGPLSRAPAALASLKLGVGELGGFTGSGTRRLGPPALFPEPGATPPAPAGAAALDSFLEGTEEGDHGSVPTVRRTGRVVTEREQGAGQQQQGDPEGWALREEELPGGCAACEQSTEQGVSGCSSH